MKGLTHPKTVVTFLVLLSVFLSGAGIVSAAVAGDFSSSFDGYNDGKDTDIRGHEIKVSGTLEFSGENAVNPSIQIKPTQNTVLDDTTVELQQSAGSSIDFRRTNYRNGVRYAADEIPADSEFEVSFVVYPVSGLGQSEIKSAEVVVKYKRPGGGSEKKTIDIKTSLNNTAPQVISSLEEAQRDTSSGTPLYMLALAAIGALAIALTVLMFLYNAVTDDEPV